MGLDSAFADEETEDNILLGNKWQRLDSELGDMALELVPTKLCTVIGDGGRCPCRPPLPPGGLRDVRAIPTLPCSLPQVGRDQAKSGPDTQVMPLRPWHNPSTVAHPSVHSHLCHPFCGLADS